MQESDGIGIKFNEPYLAVSMGFFTNYLWLSLKKGFGAIETPKHLGILIKARLVLSDIISNNLKNTFRKYREEYEANDISKEDMIAIIAEFKSREYKPENLRYEDLDGILNITPDEIEHYIVENEKIRSREKKNNKYIEELNIEKTKLQYRINEYREEEERNKDIIDKYRGKEKIQNEIDKLYIKKDELRESVKNERNRFVKYLFLNALVVIILLFIVYNSDSKTVNVISFFVSIFTIFIPNKKCPSYWLPNIYRQYKEEKNKLDECNKKIEELNENKKEMMLLMV
ncbi:MAG: hypothetical protein J6H31_10845 [Butyrivibrio sp.]|nr:hypothetical protein [Butyrivibrio sp.]